MKTSLLVLFAASVGAVAGLLAAGDLFLTAAVLNGVPLAPGAPLTMSNAEIVRALRTGELVFVEAMRLPFTDKWVPAPVNAFTFILLLAGSSSLSALLLACRLWWAR